LEFIQCPHCQKKYTVSNQLRAAAGKKIRCKHCSEGFEIQIQQASNSPAPIAPEAVPEKPVVNTTNNAANEASIDEPTKSIQASVHEQPLQQKKEYKQEEKPAEGKKPNAAVVKKTTKKLNIQLLITIVLLIVLIAGAIGAYLFFNKDSLFADSSNTHTKTIIPHDLIKPIDIKLPAPGVTKKTPSIEQKAVQQAKAKPLEPVQKERPKAMPEPMKKTSDKPPLSQVCKDISADYWVRSHTLATASMDTSTYMKLLNQNLEQANEIRKLCNDKRLIGKIAKAARENQKPTWIAAEISLRMDTDQPQ